MFKAKIIGALIVIRLMLLCDVRIVNSYTTKYLSFRNGSMMWKYTYSMLNSEGVIGRRRKSQRTSLSHLSTGSGLPRSSEKP